MALLKPSQPIKSNLVRLAGLL